LYQNNSIVDLYRSRLDFELDSCYGLSQPQAQAG